MRMGSVRLPQHLPTRSGLRLVVGSQRKLVPSDGVPRWYGTEVRYFSEREDLLHGGVQPGAYERSRASGTFAFTVITIYILADYYIYHTMSQRLD